MTRKPCADPLRALRSHVAQKRRGVAAFTRSTILIALDAR
jgi:hypothetical protein